MNFIDTKNTLYLKSHNYSKSKKLIDRDIDKIKKLFPYNTTVRIQKNKEKLIKRSHQTSWSDQIYLVSRFKRPLMTIEEVGIYLSDLDGKNVPGVFYANQLKIVPDQTYRKVHKIITMSKNKQIIRLRINLLNI